MVIKYWGRLLLYESGLVLAMISHNQRSITLLAKWISIYVVDNIIDLLSRWFVK